MSDMLARLLALAAMESGGADLSDDYTKAETDRHISDEVARIVSDAPEDFDTLRELSDWIATHEESAAAMNSAIQANTAGVAALYAEVAAKLNISDVDADLSSTSTNPVQNKAVQAPVARLVDAGAKNVLKIPKATQETTAGATFVSDGKNAITISGTVGDPWGTWSFIGSYSNKDTIIDCTNGNYVVAVISETENINLLAYDYSGSTRKTLFSFSGSGTAVFSGNITNIQLAAKTGTFSGEKVKIMICTGTDYAISQAFSPYAPTMRELYEMILALQNG